MNKPARKTSTDRRSQVRKPSKDNDGKGEGTADVKSTTGTVVGGGGAGGAGHHGGGGGGSKPRPRT